MKRLIALLLLGCGLGWAQGVVHPRMIKQDSASQYDALVFDSVWKPATLAGQNVGGGTFYWFYQKSANTFQFYSFDVTAPLAASLAANKITLSIPAAASGVDGYLTAADWATFTGKESVLTFSSPLSRVTNTVSCPTCVVTDGSYADPAWITSLAKSKVGLGSVEDTALSTWAGSTNITTLGTITTGAFPWANLTGVPSTFTPSAHASSHKHSGSDEVATATAAANAIPKAGAGGALADGWIPSLNASKIGAGTFDNARVAESNVTQHQAALSITESQISDLSHQHPTTVVGSLPAAADNTNKIYLVTDGATSADCSVGSGAIRVICVSNGSSWIGLARSSITYGAVASLPATCSTGDIYRTSNSLYSYQCTATNTWTVFFEDRKVVPPPSTGWTWVNQGTATSDSTYGNLFMTTPPSAGGTHQNRFLVRAVPGSTPYTLIVGLKAPFDLTGDTHIGIVFRQSSDGKAITYIVDDTGALQTIKWTNATTVSAAYTLDVKLRPGAPGIHWFRVNDDGTNRIFSYSPNKVNWVVLHTVGRTDFLTADQYGVVINHLNDGTNAVVGDFFDFETL